MIFVDTPTGKKPHADFSEDSQGRIFIRRNITWQDARHSDNSFTLNLSFLKNKRWAKFWKQASYIKFIVSTVMDGLHVYTIPKANALLGGEMKTNEYGEENLRIPVGLFTLKKITK